MWPWGHAALGYLLGRTSLSVETGHGVAYLALLVGTQFPDLVDKPLAWSAAVLPTGRSLAHSLFTLAVVVGAAWLLANRHDRGEYAVAFAIGYASHLLGDALGSLVELEFQYMAFLVWPVLPSPAYDTDPSFSAHFANLQLTPSLWAEFLLVALALLVAAWTEYDARSASEP